MANPCAIDQTASRPWSASRAIAGDGRAQQVAGAGPGGGQGGVVGMAQLWPEHDLEVGGILEALGRLAQLAMPVTMAVVGTGMLPMSSTLGLGRQ
ncbi:hypothetical protein GCM10027436_01920 [Actinophytocola sediminis]